MWACPRCQKTVADDLDVCWNCGTSRAGTTDPHDARDGLERTHNADVVELCSAADAFEAHAIANALASAGLPARVVGEVLQATAGLPAGQPVTPRVWVHSRDVSQARAILAGLQAEAVDGTPADVDVGEPEATEATGGPEEQGTGQSNGYDVSFLSLLLGLGGIACFVAGIYQGVTSHQLLATYSETATAKLVDFRFYPMIHLRSRPRENLGQSGGDVEFVSDLGGFFSYQYSVDGVSYPLVIEKSSFGPQELSIRYNPADPEDFRIAAIPPPILCIGLGVVFGTFLFFLAYQFR